MARRVLLTSPAVVLASGLVAVVVAAALVYSGRGARPDELTRVLAIGALGVCASALTAVAQRVAGHSRSKSLSQAQHEADHDGLTGLANRAHLHRELEATIQRSKIDETVFGVLFLDLDRFKVINDSMGHDVGDELLRVVAQRLVATTRNTDVVARLGGDEFVIICRDLLSEQSVEATTKQIVKRFDEPVTLNGRKHNVNVSVGVAIASLDDRRNPEELVRDADAAMYKAKGDRSGYAIFDDDQRSRFLARIATERDLETALSEGQLRVYYQPIIDVAARRPYGFEALVRWQHPERGPIRPSEFLSVAEDAGMMSKIGEFVLREACAQAALWSRQNPAAAGLRMNVNLAEQQLADPHLPQLVADVLAWSGISRQQLVLEITEDVIVEHLGGLDVLDTIREMGVDLAIDDFGTGQSSLSYIKQLKMVSTLKIDRAFVSQMQTDPADQAIIEAIVAMASALDLGVVAEGVENREQLSRLSDLGVHLMQGYLFSGPLPPDDAAALVLPRLDPTHTGLTQ
ncbi:MAG: putative bifunctional diguanylate cyclase/phosphodiesterase [Acidimicrobiales bacterium]